ncbi:hypothetical protein ACP70R_032353 [Stipagrostis hirtigluma subsp. patula]
MYPDLAEKSATTTPTVNLSVASEKGFASRWSLRMLQSGTVGLGCSCGSSCKCNPCNC